jgi:hypothetical protein
MREAHQSDWDSWNAWVDGRINTALEHHQEFLTEAVGDALGETRLDLRTEFRKELGAGIAQLGVELRELITGVRSAFVERDVEFARRLAIVEKETAGLRLRGQYRSDEDYERLDVVMVDGSSYVSRRDGPAHCPGGDWQLLASCGAAGAPGPQGDKGDRGPPGPAGETGPRGRPAATIAGWRIDAAHYVAIPVMDNGTEGPRLELRPLFEQFFEEART